MAKRLSQKRLSQFDLVIVNKGKCAGKYGQVCNCGGGKIEVEIQNGDEVITKHFKPKSLTYVAPVKLFSADICSLVRFETTIEEKCGNFPRLNYEVVENYQMTLEDLIAALENAIERDDESASESWYWMTFDELYECAGIWECTDEGLESNRIPVFPNRYSVFDDARDALMKRFEVQDDSAPTLPQILKMLQTFQRDEHKPPIERELNDEQKRLFLRYWDNDTVSLFGSQAIEALYTKFVTELAEANDVLGLHEMAYACYGDGNAGFKKDWERSRDCLLRLEEIAPKSLYANTLGYLYYYGRCTNGEPDYDKAFYWFSLGALGGNYESRYKLADMVKEGKGCHKDTEIASHAMWDLYNENLRYFCHGWGRTKFADIALRIGNLYRDGIGRPKSPRSAYPYYLMAKLAIRMRRQSCDAYGDEQVERSIDEAIAEVLPKSGYETPAKKVRYASFDALLRFALGYGRRIRMDYETSKKGNLKLTFRMEDKENTRYDSKFPVLIPEAGFCGLVEKLVVTVKNPDVSTSGLHSKDPDKNPVKNPDKPTSGLHGKKGSIVFDEIGEEHHNYGAFLLHGEFIVRIKGDITADCRGLFGKKRRYASVSFGDPNRTWEYLCDDPTIQAGSKVRVPWGDLIREGTVKRVCERYDSEVELWHKAYKRILPG